MYTTDERLGPISFSLHMGHCIVMGEALLVVMVPQEAPRIGTFTFQNVVSGEAPSMPHMLKSHIKDAEAADKAEGELLHANTLCHRVQRENLEHGPAGNKSGTMLPCFMEELRKTTR